MRGTFWAALVAAGLGGCAGAAGTARVTEPSACDAPDPTPLPTEVALPAEPPWGARIRAIELRGLSRVPESLVRGAITTRAGDTLDEAQVARDVLALLALETFDQVVASTEQDGAVLLYSLTERRLVGRVEHRSGQPLPVGRHVPLASGELHDPARVHRAARDLEDHLIESGHVDARVLTRERRSGERVDVCFVIEPGPRRLISAIVPQGNTQVLAREILALIDNHDRMANRIGAPFRADLFGPDRLRIQALYYDRGYLESAVSEPAASPDRGGLRVVIPIHEGAVYRLDRVSFSGMLRATEQRYHKLFAVPAGRVFSRSEVSAGLDRVVAHHRSLGFTARVTPQTDLDNPSHTVNLRLVIEEDAP